MFDAETLAQFAARHAGIAPEVVRQCAEWVTERAGEGGVANPNAVLEAALKRRATALRAAAPTGGAAPRDGVGTIFVGFDLYGRTFRSEQPVANEPTLFAQMLIREVPLQLLTPAECVWMLSRHSVAVQHAFGYQAAGRWGALDRIDQWHLASGETELSSCVAGYVQRLRDREPERWSRMVLEWCRREKQPGPAEHAAAQAETMTAFLPAGVIAKLREEAERERTLRLGVA